MSTRSASPSAGSSSTGARTTERTGPTAVRFDVITLFPELFAPHLTTGVMRRAFESRRVDGRLGPLREHAGDASRRVDDRPYGGGPGMVMLVEPLERALAAIRAERLDEAPVLH